MSQAGIVDFIGTHPEIPTMFVANVGTAVPIANTIELLGAAVAAHGVPLQTVASGNTVDFNIQYSSAAASSVAGNAGVASFDSASFSVDANGYVTLSGGAFVESFTVDAATAPGTNPVTPNGSGIVTVTGGQVAAGTTTNVIRTISLAANTYTIQIQRSQAVGSSTVGDNGVCHFSSTYFTVDGNGFVSLSGTGVGQTITGDVGGALSPTAGNWNILGTSTAAGTTPVQTSGSGSTLTIQVQKAQAIGTTNATNVGLAAFDSARFSVDANGFVTLSGTGVGQTITGQSGGALSPTAGNWNIYGSSVAAGTTPVATSGSGSTLTVNVQTAQAIASTNATNIGLAAFNSTYFTVDANGFVSVSGTGLAQTITGNSGGALSPTAGNWNIVGTGSITTSGSVSTLTVQLTGLTNHNVLVGAGTATVTNVAPSATAGIPLVSNGSSADPSFTTAVVAGGGTGNTTFTAYAVICAGTTATGAFQNVSGVGTSGQVLTSNGPSMLPSWQTNATGDVTGPGSSTDRAIATWNGTTGTALFNNSSTIIDSAGNITSSAANAGSYRTFKLINSDNTNSGSHALILANTGGTSGGQPVLNASIGSTRAFGWGLDPSDSNALKEVTGASDTVLPASGTLLRRMSTAGAQTLPLQPSFCAIQTSNVTDVTGDGTAYTVIFGTELFDRASNYDNTTGIFTAPVTGIYHFSAFLLYQQLIAAATSSIQLITTARNYTFGNFGGANVTTDGNMPIGLSLTVPMTAGDTAKINATVGGMTKVVDIYGNSADARTCFSGFLVA